MLAAHRMFRYVAVIVVAVTLAGCGVGMPPPTKKPVTVSDIAGGWQYAAAAGGGLITFDSNGTYVLILRHQGSGNGWTNKGTWTLQGADLMLSPFWTMDISGAPRIDQREQVRWWITDWYGKTLAPFGGDSLDPDQYRLLERVKP